MPDLRLDPDNHLWRQVDYRWAPRLGPNGRCSRRLCTVFTLPEAARISPGAVLQLPHFIYAAQNLPHKIPSPRASSPYYQSLLSFSITLKLTFAGLRLSGSPSYQVKGEKNLRRIRHCLLHLLGIALGQNVAKSGSECI